LNPWHACELASLSKYPHTNPYIYGRHLRTFLCLLNVVEAKQAVMPDVKL
jgi:hypothetical protein